MNNFQHIASHLPDPFRLLWREQVGSTNDELRKLAEQGMAEGLVLVAEEQVAGRGRRGAVWVSPKGENLAFSILLKPTAPKALWHRFSLVAGLAVAEALENYVPLSEIKWPNDVRVGEKKIAGILVEAGTDFVIVGIGININSKDFPEELAATSLREQTGRVYSRAEVLHEVVVRLSRYADRINQGYADSLKSIRERCALTGHLVSYLMADQRREGIVRGIGSAGELMVETDGKLEGLVQADEVRILD
jgi:BirA family transcriptional regulator, biotin operon repressor / biotin---[acetyl-CoA-carboxylase] ligase